MSEDARIMQREKLTVLANFISAHLIEGKPVGIVLQLLKEKKVPAELAERMVRRAFDLQGLDKLLADNYPAPAPVPASIQTDEPIYVTREESRPRLENPAAFVEVLVEMPEYKESRRNEMIDYIVDQLERGVVQSAIIDRLIASGVKQNNAVDLVVDAQDQMKGGDKINFKLEREMNAKAAQRKMWIGGIALIGGIVVTVASYSVAKPGGTYILFYGPIIYGAIYLISGVIEWLKNM